MASRHDALASVICFMVTPVFYCKSTLESSINLLSVAYRAHIITNGVIVRETLNLLESWW